jgi:pyrroline-5-carboxylate reductase
LEIYNRIIFEDMGKESNSIAIIGGGNLGAAIAEGLIKSNFLTPRQLYVTRRNTNPLKHLKNLGVNVTCDNAKAIQKSEVIIIALKPYNVKEVMGALEKKFLRSKFSSV